MILDFYILNNETPSEKFKEKLFELLNYISNGNKPLINLNKIIFNKFKETNSLNRWYMISSNLDIKEKENLHSVIIDHYFKHPFYASFNILVQGNPFSSGIPKVRCNFNSDEYEDNYFTVHGVSCWSVFITTIGLMVAEELIYLDYLITKPGVMI